MGGVDAVIDEYGNLYNTYAAQSPKGICPTGWHVSTLADVAALEDFLPTYESDRIEIDWQSIVYDPIAGQDPPCFRLEGSAFFDPGEYHFNDIYMSGNPNTASLLMGDLTPPPYQGIAMYFDQHGHGVWTDDLQMAAPVRCVMGASDVPEVFACGESTVNYHGHDYQTETNWDGRCWFQEDLKTELYANGDSIEGDLTEAEWLATTDGAQAVYADDESNLETYGRLYNHHAVTDLRGLCPAGWRTSTAEDWSDLFAVFGGL